MSQPQPLGPYTSITTSDIPTDHLMFPADEEVVLNILKENSPMDLNALKEQTGLSNKKWDKAIKGLTKNNLARVEKTDAGLLVSLV
ncbi:MAG: hypothetical protein QNK35_04825 [Bacteroides sp.]|nr:hypothetical protein [Bacteroides sp.]